MLLCWTPLLYFTYLGVHQSGAIDVKDHRVFTINSVELIASPSNEAKNGAHVNLTCIVDISQNVPFLIENKFSFYKDDGLIYNVTSELTRAVYSIAPARVSHSGDYSCNVVANGKERSSQGLSVRLTGLAKPNITIFKEEAREGDSVEVLCEVPEEKPPFVFTFIKTNQNQKREEFLRNAPHKNSVKTKFQVAEGDLFLVFQCSAKIQSVPDPETSDLSERKIVAVRAPFSAPKIRIGPKGNITEGNNMTVECSVVTAQKPDEDIEITIQKDKQIIRSAKDKKIVFNVIATVADMGNYTCKAESDKVSKTSSLYITVAELFPRPQLVKVSTHISEGDTLSLSCYIRGHNSSSLNFFIVKNETLRRPMKQSGKYSIRAAENDSGSYMCGVTIQNITKISLPVQIFVYAAVSRPVLTYDTRGADVVVGHPFQLKCKSSRGTPPIEYTLFRGTETLGRVNVTDNTAAVFTVSAASSHHLAQYRCEAKNKNRAPWLTGSALNISAIAPVQETSLTIIPENGEVEGGKELSLVCKVKHGSLPITFIFYYKDQHNKDHMLNKTTVNADHAYWIYPDIKKSKEGTYFCTASNKATRNTTSSSAKQSVKVVLASWKKTIIASFVIALSIAVCAGFIWWYLQKKKKAKELALPMARTANSNNEKMSSVSNTAVDSYYGPNENGENHIVTSTEEKKGLDETNDDVEYVEVMQDTPDTHKAPVMKGTDTVYSEIRQSQQDAEENNTTERIQGSPDAT